jgi:hypothetical protein
MLIEPKTKGIFNCIGYCSLAWTEFNTNVVGESYVNLIPTSKVALMSMDYALD